MTEPFDALLVLSFGGPEGREQVLPFLDNVLKGRAVPQERKLAVARHYYHFGGVSPINQANRDLLSALDVALQDQRPSLQLFWGNRNWRPFLPDTLLAMRARGVRRALVFVTSAFSSYSGCRQYLENLDSARDRVGDGAPELVVLRRFYNHPLFISAMADRVREAVAQVGGDPSEITIVFTAHSIPMGMSRGCDYVQQFEEASKLTAESAGVQHWQLAYQSRSGPPQVPWLEPDILDALEALAAQGRRRVVVCPIGFVSDHMEVVWDLDQEAQQEAEALGLAFARAKTAGTHPDYVAMVRELVLEHTAGAAPRALGQFGPRVSPCRPGCCPARS